jgi:hypothetical protein
MFNYKLMIVVLGSLLFLAVVAGCTAGSGVQPPDREVPISNEIALEAQNLAMSGVMTGSVELSESQFSSLVTGLLDANTGDANPVESITAWFEEGMVYIRIQLLDGVLPPALGNTLDVVGSISVEDNHLVVDLQQASAGGYTVSGAALDPIEAQINRALANMPLGVPVSVTLGSGTLTIDMAQ